MLLLILETEQIFSTVEGLKQLFIEVQPKPKFQTEITR
jgi:hypothetical protein